MEQYFSHFIFFLEFFLEGINPFVKSMRLMKKKDRDRSRGPANRDESFTAPLILHQCFRRQNISVPIIGS